VFSLKTHLDEAYNRFPEGANRPLIGITANHEGIDATLRDAYYNMVWRTGALPVIIPPLSDSSVIAATLDRIDGLILSGGGDINPLWTGEQPSPRLHNINAARDLPELLTVRLAYNRQVPMLGICRGMQTLAVALDGKVAQDIDAPTIKHSQDADRSEPTHTVALREGSTLRTLYDQQELCVNSFHHQAVTDTGRRFNVAAEAPDGVIEAMESSEEKSIIGVQWHPEWLDEGLVLFEWLAARAEEYRKAKEIHRRIITLDTHCDTPMFFNQGVRFDRRDPRILVDMHKMSDGRLQAVTMAAYLPQPKQGERFCDKVDAAWVSEMKSSPSDGSAASNEASDITPFAYANAIFDKIEHIVETHKDCLAIARSPQELREQKAAGRRCIMPAIENGLALEGNIDNVAWFARRGVVYITLCHNGDNDICDSAKGNGTHGGVSALGEEIIHEMNRQGIMVDLSHAAEKSFFDALQLSHTPIVCSHSNCRALCDHPRNLTDEQLRALARAGGVAHTTLYAGFLRAAGEADINDAVAHLEHAIGVMGIDCVGLGTDFDGDGGVRGFADASEALQFTIRLLRRKYSEEDIRKIWGGNWLRVMEQVQQSKEKVK